MLCSAMMESLSEFSFRLLSSSPPSSTGISVGSAVGCAGTAVAVGSAVTSGTAVGALVTLGAGVVEPYSSEYSFRYSQVSLFTTPVVSSTVLPNSSFTRSWKLMTALRVASPYTPSIPLASSRFSAISIFCTFAMVSASALASITGSAVTVGTAVGVAVGSAVGSGVMVSGFLEYSYCNRQESVFLPAMPSTVSFSLIW